MNVNYFNEGNVFEKKKLQEMGFDFDDRDYRKRNKRDKDSGKKVDEFEYVFNFSGFLINEKADVCTVFPINYVVEELKKDSELLFNVISKHIQARPEIYLGSEYGKKYESNYPFAAFFAVYNYYKEYGLYFEDEKSIKPNVGGKINWKETIRLSNKYVINNKLFFHPLYFDKSNYNTVFLTEAMIFVINHTIDKFDFIIDIERINLVYSEEFSLDNRRNILEKLYDIRQETFKDVLIILIDNLINYFLDLKEGGSYYLKHYSFSSLWEDMVQYYLKYHFKEVKNNQLVLEKHNKKLVDFKKRSFRPNSAKKNQYISPDYYYTNNDIQFIFDAKYYKEIHGMDYKQIAYFLFLKNRRESLAYPPKYSTTHSALILPGVQRESKIHFQMEPLYNSESVDLIIFEEYLVVRDVLKFYIGIT